MIEAYFKAKKLLNDMRPWSMAHRNWILTLWRRTSYMEI